MLFGEYEAVEEFISFLCKACFVSYSFAHKIIWFLKSMMHLNDRHDEKIRQILFIIQTIYKSGNNKKDLERLHVVGSNKYFEYLHKSNKSIIYNNQSETECIENIESNEINDSNLKLTRRKLIRENLDRYIDEEYNKIITEKDELKLNNNSLSSSNIINNNKTPNILIDNYTDNKVSTKEIKLESIDIYIETFKKYGSATNNENMKLTQNIKQIDMDDSNLSCFLSNINFIDHLCKISEVIRNISNQEQKRILLNELKKVNKSLPSNVYLPFLNESIRNYVIARIPLSEVKILKTKNRAPYLITLECFRLDELTYNMIDKTEVESNRDNLKIEIKKSSNSSSNEEEDNSNFINIQVTLDNKKVQGNVIQNCKSIINDKNKYKKSKCNKLNKTTKDDFGIQKNKSFINTLLEDNRKYFNKTDMNNHVDRQKFTSSLNNFNKPDLKIKNKSIKSFIEPANDESNNSNGKSDLESFCKNKFKLNKINYLLESEVNISKPVVIKNILTNTARIKNKAKSEYENLENETDPEDSKKIDIVVSEVKSDDEKNYHSLTKAINYSDLKDFDTCKDKEISKVSSLNGLDSDENEDDQKHKNISNDDKLIKNNSYHDIIFGEKLQYQTERLRKLSPYGNLNTFKLTKIIIKSGEDLRQEQFATQLINEFYQIFKLEKVDCWVNTYEILATGNNVGIIEVVPNSISLDELKKKSKQISSMKNFYELYFSPINSDKYKQAMKNFISSLAGYSLICYFLQIKDRHNANILIDDEGHLMHIDFGFMLSNAPGKGLNFEKAPFKLTKEFVDVMGGVNSNYFTKFRKLLWKGFIAVAANYEKILILIEMMYCGHGNKLPCFEKGQIAIDEIRSRFIPKPNMKPRDYMKHVDNLIEQSIDNWRTKWYDKYQYFVQGIFY